MRESDLEKRIRNLESDVRANTITLIIIVFGAPAMALWIGWWL